MDKFHGWTVSTKPLHIGLILSVILILASYRIVTYYHLTNVGLIMGVFALGIVQALLQLVFFMHLGLENRPYWYMITFLFTALIVLIVVGGTIWIMSNLNYHLMP
ncbi:MAG: hypothetical protein A3D96_00770 [Chlamydiae bacterium RIFCSPHIGHO2_12_FULL_44_59]|nr:MAG: hypothetical protein A2796_00215 [Chlamydiae bacterium RIFCSPHIGHO2_01_FULL_44_39]OGN58455.1 MAG: hypothetical protein A3C42_03330 [Chlamydiae bacterium RIFCSPHIGHO2_02_FULL_45_9]OGN59980.1 MAG: hypothetical protein A3D96_00770 [Chlamydiae bacterium RIFCSPHIGHO2_12_FULL_44_59]OGN66195.1 MAG: hypothetical protein A2978_06095 [Chlamydiae bacterium RIFCSPLOWO2_01_FULL_44_52]OGN69099.1 MAG: hypothetical protein A3I67_07580 [Chlamydiae bacterium RIFCSPLOWO2_02_FULL_45_22]OGN69879.1 MAG: hyp